MNQKSGLQISRAPHSSSSDSSKVCFFPSLATIDPWFLALPSEVALPLLLPFDFPLPSLPLPLPLPSLPLPSLPLPLPSLPLPLPSLPLPPSPAWDTWIVRPPNSVSSSSLAFSKPSLALKVTKAMPLHLPSSFKGILSVSISPQAAKVSRSDSSSVSKDKPRTNAVSSLLPFPLPLPFSPLPLPFEPWLLAKFTLRVRPP